MTDTEYVLIVFLGLFTLFFLILTRRCFMFFSQENDPWEEQGQPIEVTVNVNINQLEEKMSKLTDAVDALGTEVAEQGKAFQAGLARIKDDFAVLTSKLEAALADDEEASHAADRVNASILELQNQRSEFSSVDPDPTNPPAPEPVTSDEVTTTITTPEGTTNP